jgi:glycosyltransferase involved in cell wall biosynthesis
LDGLVKLSGPVVGDAKAALLRRADVFLHPSRSEGHPMAVLEALAYGVPCLVTPVTNMAEEVAAAGAGWKMEPSPQGIAAGIRKAVTDGIDALQAAGEKARRLAVENYGWDKIAARSVEAYRKYAA